MSLAIVIPITDIKGKASYTQLDELLTSIVAGGVDKLPVICCFDAVDENFEEYFKEKYLFITSFNHTSNRYNFAKNANIGLRYAHKELESSVLLVNQDCVLPDLNILQRLTQDDFGISTPMTREVLVQEEELRALKVYHKFPFYCPFIHKKVMDEIGYLCESFVASFEDDDYITRALLAGFPVFQTNVVVHHKGSHIDQNANGGSLTGAYDNGILGLNLQKYIWRYSIDLSDPEVQTNGGIDHSKLIPWVLKNKKYIKENCYES